MPKYRITLENDDQYDVEVDADVPNDARGRAYLQRELAIQQRNRALEMTPVHRGLQQVLNAPAALLNSVSEFISSDAPGGPQRRRAVPEVHAPDAIAVSSAADRFIEGGMNWLWPETHLYDITLEDGTTHRLALDRELPPGEAGQQLLQRLVVQQLSESRAAPQTTPGRLGKQVLGGARDAVQGTIDLPAHVVNTLVVPHLSPDPPGGPRRQLTAPVVMPQLPNTAQPQPGWETRTRRASEIASGLLMAMGSPTVRQLLGRLIGGNPATTPMLFEPNRVVGKSGTPGFPRVPTLAPARLEELSEGGANLAKLLGLPHSTDDIARMTMHEAARARGVLQRVAVGDPTLLESGPLGELHTVIENQLLRYR